MSLARRLARLEAAAASGPGCPRCRGRVVNVVFRGYVPEMGRYAMPPTGPYLPESPGSFCARCGRDCREVHEVCYGGRRPNYAPDPATLPPRPWKPY